MMKLGFLLLAALYLLPAEANAVARTEEEFEREVDLKNEDCAHLALATKRAAWSGQQVNAEDSSFKARLKNCSQQASRKICNKTRQILESSPATAGKNLLNQCSGPLEARAIKTALTIGQMTAACKLAIMVANCLTGNLPVEPSLTDIPSAPITRPKLYGPGGGVGDKP